MAENPRPPDHHDFTVDGCDRAGGRIRPRREARGLSRGRPARLSRDPGANARRPHSARAPASPCTGRLSNRIHSFFVETGERVADFTPEPGLTVALKTAAELVAMIKADE